MDSVPVLQVLAAGGGGSLQDRGRIGWRSFGVPVGGAMDDHAMDLANRLLDNPVGTPVLELGGGGQRFQALRAVSIAIAGASCECSHPTHRVVNLQAGEELSIGRLTNGVWVILALAGGFISRPWLGSVSAYARAGVGVLVKSGLELFAQAPRVRSADRLISPAERRDRQPTPPLLVWPGPQWDQFAPEERRRFFQQVWTVSRQCDRVGYRLEGEPLRVPAGEMISEPQPVGAIQISRDGRPIVLMRDGPAVGGYPKMGILDPGELSRLGQCAPGGLVRFIPGEGKSI